MGLQANSSTNLLVHWEIGIANGLWAAQGGSMQAWWLPLPEKQLAAHYLAERQTGFMPMRRSSAGGTHS